MCDPERRTEIGGVRNKETVTGGRIEEDIWT
jgi:hypothetical protein